MAVRFCTVFVSAVILVLGEVHPLRATPITFSENLGNFPDAVAISATGFLFHLTNTSFGDGAHSSFVRKPDGAFTVNHLLTATAAAELNAGQPFGIFSFGAALPDGAGQLTSAPSGFAKSLDPLNQSTGLREVNFRINLADGANGPIFDSAAPSIPSAFINPRTGTFDFFISTPSGFTLASLPGTPDGPGIDVKTELAWMSAGTVLTFLPNPGDELAPRGQLQATPEPSSLILMASGLAGLGGIAWRRRLRK